MVSAASLCAVLARINRGINALKAENTKTRETWPGRNSIASGHMIDPENPLFAKNLGMDGHVD
ncbi:unnamed protein product [Fusarium venenatum]|uniref:Uncharacterized protein n=1 Tax=Fusarium venenatum TaxID=56646 RepID=A0A2L2TJR5_9HYPO|nr:uncharacterized protein FVRRES_13288 [Fusarium venenatum]CEI40815.1 unnamed protein product [Fusarium venenatum]